MGLLDFLGLQPKKFKYSLFINGQTYVLPNAPIGWEENIIKWSRSQTYFGMIRTFTVPLEFVLDGAWLLRAEFYTKGLNGSALLYIDELNPGTWQYLNKYTGEIDFSTFNDELNQVTVTVMEGDISARIKAYEDIKYTIPLDIAEAVDVEITPLKLNESAQFINLATDGRFNRAVLGLDLIVNEVQAVGEPSSVSVEFLSTLVLSESAWDGRFFYKAKIDTDLTLSGNIQGSFKGGTGSGIFTVSIYKSGISGLEAIIQLAEATLDNGAVLGFDNDFNHTITLLEGDLLYLTCTQAFGGNVTNAGTIITEGELNLSYFTGSPATFCKTIRGAYLFNELIKKMNNGTEYPIQSNLLVLWKDIVFTSGEAIRGLSSPVMITSFKDFFISINAVLNAGFGIESGKAVLEGKEYFFKSLLKAADVGENKSFNLEVYEPYIYNSVKIGYPDQKFSTIVDNNQEVNNTQNYSLPIIRIQKELDLLSIYRADPYGIEDTRITPTGSSSNNNNNDVFMILIKPDPENISGTPYYHPLRTEGYTSISGVVAAETYYNYSLSPKSNLLRHGDYLHSILDKFDSRAIIFESGLKNILMSVVYLTGQRITENANLAIGTLPDKIFLPYLITIETKLPRDMSALMQAFPTGYIRSQFLSNNQDGFIIDAGADISRNTERELKLLLTPYNELENLIH